MLIVRNRSKEEKVLSVELSPACVASGAVPCPFAHCRSESAQCVVLFIDRSHLMLRETCMKRKAGSVLLNAVLSVLKIRPSCLTDSQHNFAKSKAWRSARRDLKAQVLLLNSKIFSSLDSLS